MPLLSDDDYDLSMRVSSRGKINGETLRSLLVHRLVRGWKCILRRGLRDPGSSVLGVFCEPCDQWRKIEARVDVPAVIECPRCSARYRIEMAIYTRINEEGEGNGGEEKAEEQERRA